MRRTITLVVGFLISVILAPAGAAAMAIDTVTCSLSAGTTFTWIKGTTEIQYEFDRADTTPTAEGIITPAHNGPGSDTITTPSDAVVVKALFVNKHGPSAEHAPVECTP